MLINQSFEKITIVTNSKKIILIKIFRTFKKISDHIIRWQLIII